MQYPRGLLSQEDATALKQFFGDDFDGDQIQDFTISAPGDDIGGVNAAGSVAFGGFGDTDGDGLSDLFEERVSGTDPNDPDTDGDGTNDGGERDFGTDPLDLNSYPGIADFFYEPRSGIVVVTWYSVPERHYFLEWSSDLAADNWVRLNGGEGIPPLNGETTSFFDNTSNPGIKRRFYRVVPFIP